VEPTHYFVEVVAALHWVEVVVENIAVAGHGLAEQASDLDVAVEIGKHSQVEHQMLVSVAIPEH